MGADDPRALAVLDRLTRALMPLRTLHGDLLWWQLDAKVEDLIAILGKVRKRFCPFLSLTHHPLTSLFSLRVVVCVCCVCARVHT